MGEKEGERERKKERERERRRIEGHLSQKKLYIHRVNGSQACHSQALQGVPEKATHLWSMLTNTEWEKRAKNRHIWDAPKKSVVGITNTLSHTLTITFESDADISRFVLDKREFTSPSYSLSLYFTHSHANSQTVPSTPTRTFTHTHTHTNTHSHAHQHTRLQFRLLRTSQVLYDGVILRFYM